MQQILKDIDLPCNQLLYLLSDDITIKSVYPPDKRVERLAYFMELLSLTVKVGPYRHTFDTSSEFIRAVPSSGDKVFFHHQLYGRNTKEFPLFSNGDFVVFTAEIELDTGICRALISEYEIRKCQLGVVKDPLEGVSFRLSIFKES